jgi:class 3 adenylate cyclase
MKTVDHASRALKAAFELQKITAEFSEQIGIPIEIRVGIHTGEVIAGVVGEKDPRYHLFGEAVKVVELMESSGAAHLVHCSHKTYENVQQATDPMSVEFRNGVEFKLRGDLDEKSKRKLTGLDYGGKTYYVEEKGQAGVQFRRLTLGRNTISEDLRRVNRGSQNEGKKGGSREYGDDSSGSGSGSG